MDVRPSDYSQLNDSGRVKFTGQPFAWAPTVLVGLNEFHINGIEGWAPRCIAITSDVTGAGFTWQLNSWSDTIKYSVGASYLALDNGPPIVVDDTEQINDVNTQRHKIIGGAIQAPH
jgi:H-type lectin domain